MSVTLEDNRIRYAEARFDALAVSFVRGTARVARAHAQREVRKDTRELEQSIEVVPDLRDAHLFYFDVEANADHAVYNEFGTGVHFNKSQWLNFGGAGSVSGRGTPWVYFHPRFGFITTTGMTEHPFMLPGYEAARKWALATAPRHFRGLS